MFRPNILLLLFGTTLVSGHVLRNGEPCEYEHMHHPNHIVIADPRHKTQKMQVVQPTEILAPGRPPFISHYIKHGTNLLYKPHFMMAPMNVPWTVPAVFEREDTPDIPTPEISQYIFDQPSRIPEEPEIIKPTQVEDIIENKPIVIPEAPKLPTFSMPELPTTVFVDTKPSGPIVTAEPTLPCLSSVIPEIYKPAVVPEAPKLPPYTMPQLPVFSFDEAKPPVPVSIVPEAPLVEFYRPLEIPQAPHLFPYLPKPSIAVDLPPPVHSNLIEIPTAPKIKPIEIPKAPVLPPLPMPVIPSTIYVEDTKIPCIYETPSSDTATEVEIIIPDAPELKPIEVINEIPYGVVEHEPISIPQTQEIPALGRPEPPIVQEVVPIPAELASPCSQSMVPQGPIVEIQQYPHVPIEIPQAPELPPFTMPQLPVLIEENKPQPTPFAPLPIIPEAPIIPVQQYILPPPAPQLPIFKLPKFPFSAEQTVEVPEMKPISIPTSQELQSFYPTICAQNIIMERVIPNIIVSEKRFPNIREIISTGPKNPVYFGNKSLQRT